MRHFQLRLTILLLFFIGTVSGQVRPNAHPSQIIMVTAPASDSVAVNLTIPSDVILKTLSARLNGKDVSARLASASCTQTNCQQATLTVADGLHGIKNVFSVMAKRKDGSLVSARTRFVGATAIAGARAAIANPQAVHASAVSSLPTLNSFLPPAIAFTTLKFGGYANGSPWFRVGSQNTYPANPGSYSCTGIYTVIVLDRQTLQEKTAAPESSPNCVSNGTSLKTYLATLNAGDIVIVGSNSGHNSDANAGFGLLDTSDIGGSVYNCFTSTLCLGLPPNTVALPDVPQGYMAIGVGGAASGSAYENYVIGNGQLLPTWTVTLSQATGMLVEDPDGNYTFQTSGAIEYTVTPNDPANSGFTTVTVGTIPGDPYSTQGAVSKLYRPPVAPGNNGMWMLQLQRSTLFSIPFDVSSSPPIIDGDACPLSSLANGVAVFNSCGRFYATGDTDLTTAAAAYASLQTDLANIVSNVAFGSTTDLIFLVSIGNQPSSPGFDFSVVPSGFATAFSAIGGTPETFTTLGAPGSTYSYVGCIECDNSLGGHVIISTSLQSQQGQSGYIHGLLQPNLNGLYWPTQASLDQPDTDGAPTTDFTIPEVTSTQPVEWPELSNTQKLTSGSFTADSTAGQNAAYYYISNQLISEHYIIGAQGDFIDDIHFYYTGGNNTFLDYHTYDPVTLTFPGSSPTDCFQWADPVLARGALACFTQNDFNAVRAQMHNEIIYLTNVLQFMVNGSTNMKDVVASGNGSAALALINAAAEVQASTLQPPPATPVKSKVSAILNLTANIVSTAASIATASLGVPEASAGIKLALKILGPASGVTRGAFGMASAITSGLTTGGRAPLPSRDYPFLTTIGNLSNNSLQQGFTAGFDSGLDAILADWYKLSTIGPMITDAGNPAFQSPTQSSQLLGITQIGQGSQRTFYLALLPIDYSVQHYTYWYGQTGVTNFPDMGARTEENAGNCNTWYYSAPAPSTINLVSKSYLSYSDEAPTKFAFWYENGVNVTIPMPLDWFVVASSAAPKNPGTASQLIQLLDPQVASTLFNADQLNIPMDAFLDQGGPMASVWGDSAKVGFNHFPADQTCSLFVAGKFGGVDPSPTSSVPPTGSTGGRQLNPVSVTLNIPATGVLGDSVALKAAAVVAGSPVTSGIISFADGGNELGRPSLDGTGTATLSVSTLTLGTHTISASFVATQQLTATNPVSASLTIYVNAPDLVLALSAASLTAASGTTSSPLALQATSKWGLAGAVTFTCSGLPVGATCSFTPSQVTLTDGSSASTSLTISDQKHTARLRPSLPLFAIVLLPLPLLRWKKHATAASKSLGAYMVAGVLLSLFLAACGGSSMPPPVAQPISSTVLITATSGEISRSVPLNLTLQ